MNKEQIYDAEISPLMTQIIAICQKNKISMLATFDIPTEEDSGLCCTTCLADESGKLSVRIAKLASMANRGKSVPPMMLTTEHADGSKTITAILG